MESFVNMYFNSDTIISKIIQIIFVMIAMYFAIKMGKHLIKKFVERQVASSAMLSLDSQRAKTLGEVLKSVLNYSVYFMGIAIIVSILFGEISSTFTFTFASIGGIAVGLGAQSLIKDLINGFFILFENQFGVGDHVTLGNFNGIVKSIGIRTTVIIDFTGDINFIPNGSIIGVTNHSRNDIRFAVDVNISYEENIEKVISIIEITCNDFKSKNEEYISVPIEVSGVTALGTSSVTIRVVGKAKPLSQWKMENELRKEIKLTLDKNKIEMPYPKTQLSNESIGKDDKK
ncbi:mechanosensitive ion channel family protein [Clostridium gelidum]|nr:mechanosensitive ion channel family protein [Clostridium gelidum]